ncbi:MAG: DUF6770 family protein [Tunicatimonas sp.]
MNLLKYLSLVVLFCLATLAHGQKMSLPGLQNYSANSLSPIYEKNEVKGYMLYYRSDKADRKSEGNENMTGGINLFAVPGQGFIRNTYIGMGKSYSLTMYDNNLKPVWTISGEKSKDYETLALSEVNGKYAMGTIIRRPGLFSTKFSAHLAAFDITTGRKVLDTPIETNEKSSCRSV